MTAAETAPLAGITVVDLSRVLAGPYCTWCSPNLGARVIKIERPADGGDDAAPIGPFVNGDSAYFSSVNHGKESIALDLKPRPIARSSKHASAGRRAGRELPSRHHGAARLRLGDFTGAIPR